MVEGRGRGEGRKSKKHQTEKDVECRIGWKWTKNERGEGKRGKRGKKKKKEKQGEKEGGREKAQKT